AAFLLRQMAVGFPPGTIHVAVVDPGVGGRRAPIVIETEGGSALVGPDNGVLAPLAHALGSPRGHRILPAALHPPGTRLSRTFEGRDVFAPAAVALATGRDLSLFSESATFTDLALPAPARTPGGISGEVLHTDRFGNLITNVPTEWLPATVPVVDLRVGRRSRRSVPVVATYEEIPPGAELAVLGSSFGTLEVSVREGSAARTLGATSAAPVRLRWPVSAGRRRAQEGK
ncbi:MAG TPA: SAM-dependent chlorinase/fluorinase, partial [Thermoplasmata archaeon]|nr:SAM-dependent chlorinase/fluorinase [Thermoplasmata archaeon]